MKVITLTQPYATLVAIRAKRIETRSWATSYRGPLAIHAGVGLRPVGGRAGLYDLAFSDADGYFYSALHAAHMFCIDDLPRGAIVATARLERCVDTFFLDREERVRVTGFDGERRYWNLTDQERAFGDYTPGRYAWLLAAIVALPEPIPAKGALGLWNWEGDLTGIEQPC